MKNIIYIKIVENYNDILKNKYTNMPLLFKKFLFMYKYFFNIITKKNTEGINTWVLPINEKYSMRKIKILLKKIHFYDEKIYVIPEKLNNSQIYKIMNDFGIRYLKGDILKKLLIVEVLKYIINIQCITMSNIELTILVNDTSELNMFLIEKLAKETKSIKIVSSKIYKFKKLEERLYEEYGIPIQFSNSHQKSLAKSKIIINLDFNELDISEYRIDNDAIIINCFKEKIKIKSKLFNGIVVNNYKIELLKEIKNKFKKANLFNEYNNFILYESMLNSEKNIFKIYNRIEEDEIIIKNLVGNNGIINKNEFKNICKILDKK